MSSLTNKEKVLIADVLEIKNGYIFDRLRQIIDYNKTNTRNIIWGACGIDIFVEQPYVDLSQQKCIEYIWDHEDDNVTYHVLHDLLDFYFRNYPKNKLSGTMKAQFNRCLEILRRLQKTQELPLPSGKTEQLKVLQKDITDSLAEGNPELCIDRLHTFATEYIRHVCDTHGVSVLDDKGEHLPLHSIMGALSKFYRDNQQLDSDFSVTALRNSISLFSQYNDMRNKRSFAHPNAVLSKAEATYAVRTVSATLALIADIEETIKN